jgi:hypothetical protein
MCHAARSEASEKNNFGLRPRMSGRGLGHFLLKNLNLKWLPEGVDKNQTRSCIKSIC